MSQGQSFNQWGKATLGGWADIMQTWRNEHVAPKSASIKIEPLKHSMQTEQNLRTMYLAAAIADGEMVAQYILSVTGIQEVDCESLD